MSTAVSARGISKRFGAVEVLHDIDLEVAAGSVVALLGPSGCGKTTLLRILCGLERPDGGSVTIADRLVAGDGAWVPPEKRRVGMVFQDWALFPHRMRSSVVLPQPDGPSSATTEPAATSRSMSCSTSTAPNRFEIPDAATAVAMRPASVGSQQ